MGRKSREKKEARENNPMSSASKKVLRDLIRESKPEAFAIEENGKTKIVYYNPLKKLLSTEAYKSDEGKNTTQEMVQQYQNFLKQRFKHEQIAKANGVDIEEVEDGKRKSEQS